MRIPLYIGIALSQAAHAAPLDLPAHFDPRALVKPITEMQGILSDGGKGKDGKGKGGPKGGK